MNERVPVLLVAADAPDAARLERDLVRADPRYAVESVSSLRDALSATARGDFRCVLTASELPDGDATDLLRSLGPDAGPVVVLAPTWDAALAESLLRAGADDYVVRSETDPLGLVRAVALSLWRRRPRPAEPDPPLVLRTPPPLACSGAEDTDPALAARAEELILHLEELAGYPPGFVDNRDPQRLYRLAPLLGWEAPRLARETARFLGLDFLDEIAEDRVDFRYLPPALSELQRCVPLDEGARRRLVVANPFDSSLAGFVAAHGLDLAVAAPRTIRAYLERPLYDTPTLPGEAAGVPAPLDEPEHITLPGLRIEKKLGAGASAIVFQAVQELLGRSVALKVLPRNASTSSHRQRFRREAKVLAGLDHPAIIRIHDTFDWQGHLCNVMEFASGGSLRALLDRHPLLPEPVVAFIAARAADGLCCAARRGIVHRDVKPGNLLLLDDGTPKIGDFGLSIRQDREEDRLTRAGYVLGTPAYMAPEYWLDGIADHRSDLYSLGCTMFEMLTGEQPFAGSSPGELMIQHVSAPAPDMRALQPTLSASICATVAALLRKEPAARPVDGAALAAALAPLVEGAGPDDIRELLR